jgi:uroporphyrinogen decarboxylase
MEIGDIDKLEVPDSDKPVGGYVEAQKLCDRCVEMGMPAMFQGGSVFTAAAVVADTSKFLKWTKTEPKSAHALLDKVTQMYINQIEYFANRYGPEKCVVFDGGPVEANTVISPQKFEEFAFPYMMKVHKKIRELDIPVTLMHPCADQNLNIPYYIKLRESFNWKGIYAWIFGPETPIKTQIEKFGSHDIIGGNVDPPSIQTKSYQEVVQLCKENIEQGMDNPRGYILAPGCEFPPMAEPIKPMAFLDAARQFGVYK